MSRINIQYTNSAWFSRSSRIVRDHTNFISVHSFSRVTSSFLVTLAKIPLINKRL